jgi:hypothetical protein
MPVAEKFKALGAGNGFPYCLPKVNVLDFTKWTTLSGFNNESGGTPTQTQIDNSFALALKLFWNLNGITFDVVETHTLVPSNNYSVTVEIDGSTAVDNSPLTYEEDGTSITWANLGGDTVKENQEPKERVSYRSGSIYKSMYRANEGYNDYSCSLQYLRIVRMYDGVTTNEDNFVGYGVRSFASGGGQIYGDEWHLDLSCFGSGDPLTDFCLVKYVVIEGIPLVATFIRYYTPYPISDDPSYTVTLTSNSTSVIGNASYSFVDGQGETQTIIDELKYSNLNFYTYPE